MSKMIAYIIAISNEENKMVGAVLYRNGKWLTYTFGQYKNCPYRLEGKRYSQVFLKKVLVLLNLSGDRFLNLKE